MKNGPAFNHRVINMLARLFSLLFLALFTAGSLLLSACRDSVLDPDDPVSLSFWHVYGAQTDSPMNRLVREFNQTVGQKEGVVVNVTSLSNSTAMHFPLVAAAKGEPGAGLLPDIFVAYPKTVLAIGPERFMDWNKTLSPETLASFVPSFVQEGTVDGRLVMLPVAKSSSALFVNAGIFEKFAAEKGFSYGDLLTWEGMFRVAEAYFQWSGGKAFFKYDDWLHYSMVNMASFGKDLFKDGRIDFDSPQFARVWKQLAKAAASGHVCLLDGYSTTAMMTGESICGVESIASILYFKDRVTFPDNTHMPLTLSILPVPYFAEAEPLAIQRGSGLCVPKSTEQKEKAAAIFAEWLTREENNLPFVMAAGYMPVQNAAFERIRDPQNIVSPTPNAEKLYQTVNRIRDGYRFWVPPYFDSYGELEKKFCEEQMRIFARCRAEFAGRPVTPEDLDAMFEEFRAVME